MMKCKVCGSIDLDFKEWVNQIKQHEAMKNNIHNNTNVSTHEDPYCNNCEETVRCE